MNPVRARATIVAAMIAVLALAASDAAAGAFKIEEARPVSGSKALTLKSDKGVYWEIRPGADVVLKIEGPGTLTVKGVAQLDVPGADLMLMVQQDGQTIGMMTVAGKVATKDGWIERARIAVSSPSLQKFTIAAGVHTITVKTQPGSATGGLNFQLAREEETIAAAPEPDLIALVPLVPIAPKKDEPRPPPPAAQPAPGPEAIALVPLVALQPKLDERQVSAPPKPKEDGRWKEIVAQPATVGQPGVKAAVKPEDQKPEGPVKYVGLSPRVGMMMPVQGIGGPFPAFGFEVHYLPPFVAQPLSIGLSVDYYAPFFTAEITGGASAAPGKIDASYYVIPIQLDLAWTFETGFLVRPFVGAGGGAYVVGSSLDDKATKASTSQGGTAFGFSGQVGALSKVGPGEILAVARYNQARLSLDKTMKELHAGGVIAQAGYQFTF